MSIYDSLNDMQQQAVYHTDGTLLILAGAGSGKTRVLTHRIAYLIEEMDVNPYHILAITFTNKAAKEMRERVDQIVGFGSESIWVSTFHSMCVRILRRHIDRLGYETNFTIYDMDDSKTLMKEVLKRMNIDTKMYKERAVLNQISNAKNELLTPEQFAKHVQSDFYKKQVAEIYKEYQKSLKDNNALDFDDLIMKTVELFQTDSQVLEYYQERFRYIMVDEYQDTNTAQFQLVSTLARRYKNLCVVGDDDQSIYKFRGANIGNILNFERVFQHTKIIKLEQNYRSTQRILDAANAVIRNNAGRKSKTLWTDNDLGDKIRFLQLSDGYEEANYIAHDIKKIVEDEKRFSYSGIACLYRTNAQSRALEERLLFLNIPYKIVGGVNFYQRKEIKDILAYLKTIDNAQDDLAVKRILNVPKRGIGATTVGKISDYAYHHMMNFYDGLKQAEYAGAGRAAEKINKFVDLIQNLRGKSNFYSIKELVDDILESTGYLEELKLEGTEEAEDRIQNINEFISKVVDYEESCEDTPTLSGFLEEVALVADIDRLDEDSDYVTLMTVHAAKGLEFPKVYLAGMDDGLFPSYMSITSEEPDDLEEERRLCYVAITRAMDSLTITSARMRMVRGETQYNKVSRFVEEIPLDLLETADFGKKKEPTEKPKGQTSREAMLRKPFGMNGAKPLVNSSFSGSFSSKQQVRSEYKRPSFEGIQKGKDLVNNRTPLNYQEGDTVSHIKFGQGKVLKITEGGRDYEVTIDFEKVGVKKMLATFAKLKKV